MENRQRTVRFDPYQCQWGLFLVWEHTHVYAHEHAFISPVYFSSLHIIPVADELLKARKYMKYFITCIISSILLLCVMLRRGMEYQVAFSSDQPPLQDNLSCLSISIHCVQTALGEFHSELEAYMHVFFFFFDANDDVKVLL